MKPTIKIDMKKIILAFDIERSGPTLDHDTIGIGACVMDEDFQVLDSMHVGGYVKSETNMDIHTFKDFWRKFPDKLEELKYEGRLSYETRQIDMIASFQRFRKKWENFAKSNKKKLELVTDNSVFDGGFLNIMIMKYCKGDKPMPYNVIDGEYNILWDVYSEQRMIVNMIDPKSNVQNFSKFLDKKYPLIVEKHPRKYTNDHNPEHDAYNTAYDHIQLLKILDLISDRH